jgi:hypothetical protein
VALAGVLGLLPAPTSRPATAGAATATATQAPTTLPAQVAYPPFKPPVVIVYGDSIVHAAGPALEAMLAPHGIAVVDASVGGTAPCDALQFVPGDMAKYDPDLVVVAYVGNAFSPCINGTPDKDVIMRHYLDTQKLISEVDRPVLLATPPGRIGEGRYTSYDVLVWYEASLFGTGLVDTAKVLLDPRSHVYEKTAPCPRGDGCRRAVVRGPDDYHLSTSGGYLYAQVLSKAVLARLQPPPAGAAASTRNGTPALGSTRNQVPGKAVGESR